MTEQLKKTRESRRTPVNGVRNRINIQGKDPAYVYRLVNDINQGDRVQGFIENGWEVVQSKEIKKTADKRVADPSAEGSNVSLHVGHGTKGVLMKLPREWYNEDQQAKEDTLKTQESAMKQETEETYRGKLESIRDPK